MKFKTYVRNRWLALMSFGLGIFCSALVPAGAVVSPIIGEPVRGKALYQACEACHSIDANDIGPRHRGIVGRRAGSISDYAYSDALKKSGITWDEVSLDHWLTNPSELVPGTKMYFKLDDAQKRADIIAYLREQKTAK